MSADYPDRPVIDVWAVIADLDTPDDVLLRLLARRTAVQEGRKPGPVPDADKPFLARHIVNLPTP